MSLCSQCPRSQYHPGTFEDRLAIKFCAIQGSVAQVLKQYQDLDIAAASTPSVSFRLVSSYKMASALESAYVILAISSHSELRPHPHTRPPECKTSIVSMPRRVSAVPHIHHDVYLLMNLCLLCSIAGIRIPRAPAPGSRTILEEKDYGSLRALLRQQVPLTAGANDAVYRSDIRKSSSSSPYTALAYL